MNPSKSKTFVIALLLLAVVGLGVFGWREYDQLSAFRASQVSEKDLAAARARAFDAEKRIKELEAQLALAKVTPPADPAANGRGRGANANTAANGLAGLLQGRGLGAIDPQMIQQLISTFQTPQNLALQATAAKANLSVQYASFFRNAGLSAEQADAVTTLMANRQSVTQDVLTAALASGVQPDAQSLQSLVSDQQAQIDTQLRTTMGDAAYSQYQTYQATLPRRQEVASYQQQLTMAGVPMDAAQTDALVTALGPTTNGGGGGAGGLAGAFGGAGGLGGLAAAAGFGGAGARGGGTTNISAGNMNAAATVLTPTQLQVLQATQQSQQATAALGQTALGAIGGQQQRGGQQQGGAAAGRPNNATGNGGRAVRGN